MKDKDVPQEYQQIVKKWRRLARDMGVPDTTPIFHVVTRTITLKRKRPERSGKSEA